MCYTFLKINFTSLLFTPIAKTNLKSYQGKTYCNIKRKINQNYFKKSINIPQNNYYATHFD